MNVLVIIAGHVVRNKKFVGIFFGVFMSLGELLTM